MGNKLRVFSVRLEAAKGAHECWLDIEPVGYISCGPLRLAAADV